MLLELKSSPSTSPTHPDRVINRYVYITSDSKSLRERKKKGEKKERDSGTHAEKNAANYVTLGKTF